MKSIGIIYASWPFMTTRMVNLGDKSLNVMSGQDFANAGQIDGQTVDGLRAP